MTTVLAPTAAAARELDGIALLLPTLQPDPLPIKRIKPAPCTQACPAGVNVKAYVSLIAERRFADALEVIRRRCPLPGICGRVCHHPCEAACLRGRHDDPIAVRALKRMVADQERGLARPSPPSAPPRPERVAVIGSGPAGLTAAYDLRLAGFPVTVFEAAPEPGGMMRYGITAYRLPRPVLAAEIDVIARAGVEIRTGRRLGSDFDLDALFGQGYRAVLLAVGAQDGRPLPVKGGDGPGGVEDALEFLRGVNTGTRARAGEQVAVVGGGSTAVEAARAALRLGARQVQIVYRRHREELLADAEEVAVAEAEGIVFRFLVAPSRVLADRDRVLGLECHRVGLGEPDGSGRRRPITIPGTEFVIAADHVLAAIGQEVDLSFLGAAPPGGVTPDGRLRVGADAAWKGREGVFAAGDAVTGPATVIEAIAAGHRAAESIRHAIEEGVAGVREERPERRTWPEYELPDAPPLRAARVHPVMRKPRAGDEFGEVEQAFSVEEAVGEARRCLRCGPCGECQACAPSCPRRHVMVRRRPPHGGDRGQSVLVRAPAGIALPLPADAPTAAWLLPRAGAETAAEVLASAVEAIEVRPLRAHVARDVCRGCGRCVEVCPFHAVTLNGDGATAIARIDTAVCRGCNLCTSVCPSKAATASALSPHWWGTRLADAFAGRDGDPAGADRYVVLACQRRAGGLETALARPGRHVEVVRFRCVGQVDAGMLLDLYALGARRVLVAGCLAGRCRFGSGARLADEQVARARQVLALLGASPAFVTVDASDRRARDPLDAAVARLLDGGPPAAGPGTP